jgi:hypothetical protein
MVRVVPAEFGFFRRFIPFCFSTQGLALPVVDYAVCDFSYVIKCPADYVIVLLTTDLATSALSTQQCVFR